MTVPYASGAACASGCTIRGEHLPSCSGCDCGCGHLTGPNARPCTIPGGCGPTHATAGCTGCVPKRTAPGLAVCVTCERWSRENLAALPDLYVDLLHKPSSSGPVTGGGATLDPEACPDCDAGQACTRRHRDTPTPLTREAGEARAVIVTVLKRTNTWLTAHAHVHAPTAEHVAATTRSIAVHESAMSTQARTAAHLCGMPAADGTPPDTAGVTRHTREAHQRAARAAAARDDWETGRDVIRAWCEHAERHLDALLRDPDTAGAYVATIRDTARNARRFANRTRDTTPRVACPDCGRQVRLDPDTSNDVTCQCGTVGDIWWWWRTLQDTPKPVTPGAPERPVDGHTIAATLSVEYGRPFNPATVRQWASDGIKATVDGARTTITLERVDRAPSGRTLHHLSQARTIAFHLYGHPPGIGDPR